MKITAKLITYNRAEKLRRTLDVWFTTNFRHIPLEVLDNASTDQTADILNEAKFKYPNLSILRHKKNIGAVGNILRAYENFDSEYCWLICDDDILYPENYEYLKEALSANADAIIVSSIHLRESDLGFRGSVDDFITSGAPFFYNASFLPSLIFKSNFLNDGVLFRCYKAAGTLYPHGPILEMVASSNMLWVLNKPLISRGMPDDVSGIEINWITESIIPSNFLKHYSSTWRVQFIAGLGMDKCNAALHQCMHYRGCGLLPFGQTITMAGLVPGKYWRLKIIMIFCSLLPVVFINYIRRFRASKIRLEKVSNPLRF